MRISDWSSDVCSSDLYISKLREDGGNVMNSRFYTDVQLRFTLPDSDAFGFAIGVNNLFDKDPPACLTCDLTNFDPTLYDAPGRYFYARATVQRLVEGQASRASPPLRRPASGAAGRPARALRCSTSAARSPPRARALSA